MYKKCERPQHARFQTFYQSYARIAITISGCKFSETLVTSCGATYLSPDFFFVGSRLAMPQLVPTFSVPAALEQGLAAAATRQPHAWTLQQGLSGSFSVQKMRVRSAGSSRRGGGAGVTTPSCGSTRASRPTSAASGPLRPGSPAHSMTTTQDELTHLNPAYMPPAGKGQLAMSVFVTGDGDMQRPDPQRYAFQPRRPAGLMTPGEQQLVRQRPMTAHGRLTGRSSSSAALLLTAPTGGR